MARGWAVLFIFNKPCEFRFVQLYLDNNLVTYYQKYEKKIPSLLPHHKATSKNLICIRVNNNWQAELLSMLLKDDRLLAWWTTSRVFKRSGLNKLVAGQLPKQIDLRQPPTKPCVRRFFFKGEMMIVLDASDKNLQNTMVQWSGGDTEQVPEFIWSASDASGTWDTEVLIEWCQNRRGWSNPADLVPTHARRLIACFDGDLYCVLPQPDAGVVTGALDALAKLWGVSIIPGPDAYSWMPER